MTITHVPSDVVKNIFSFLDSDSLAKAGRVCKQWYGLACDVSLWKIQCLRENLLCAEYSKKCFLTFSGNFARKLSYQTKRGVLNNTLAICKLGKKYLWKGDSEGFLELWDLSKMRQKRKFRGHDNGITSLVCFRNECYSTAFLDNKIMRWDVTQNGLWQQLIVRSDPVRLIGGSDNTLFILQKGNIYTIRNNETPKTITVFSSQGCSAYHLSRDGWWYIGKSDGSIAIHSPRGPKNTFTAHAPERIYALTTQGNALFSCGKDGYLRVWNRFSFTCLREIQTVDAAIDIQVFEQKIVTVEKAYHFSLEYSVTIRDFE